MTIEWQSWQFESRYGFTLRGQCTAPRGLPVIHFIHGNSYSGLTYLPLWQALYPQFDIFLHDVQGHGDSDAGGDFIGWNRSAELALEVAQQVMLPRYGKVPVMGCGHSFGGVLTLLMSKEEPALFNQLLLLDPILFPQRMIWPMQVLNALRLYPLNPYAKRARKRRSQWPDAQSAWQGLHQRGMFRGWQDDALHAYVDHAMEAGDDGLWQLKCSPRREADVFSSYARGLWSYLDRLSVPTILWAGRDTYPFVRRSVATLQARNDRVQVHWVDGGHCFMQEQPQQTAAAMIEALPELTLMHPA